MNVRRRGELAAKDDSPGEADPAEAVDVSSLAEQLTQLLFERLQDRLPAELRDSVVLLPPERELTSEALETMSTGKLPADWYADAISRWGPPSIAFAGSEAPRLAPMSTASEEQVASVTEKFDEQVEWMTRGARAMSRELDGDAPHTNDSGSS